MNDLSGQLQVHLQPGTVRIRSTRPITAARVFNGKPVGFVADRLPLLFSLCGSAQAAACSAACEAALGLQPTPLARRLRACLVQAETAKEHLWRLLLDWPQALAAALAPDACAPARRRPGSSATSEMARVMRAYLALRAALSASGDPFALGASPVAEPATVPAAAAALAGLAEELVFGMPAAHWRAAVTDAAALTAWAEAGGGPGQGAAAISGGPAGLVRQLLAADLARFGRNPVVPLPRLGPAAWPRLAAALDGPAADAFIATPTWQEAPAETTPLARQAGTPLVADLIARHGNGLLARLAALLVELAEIAAELASGSGPGLTPDSLPALAPDPAQAGGLGLGLAEAARGLLVHRVQVEGERVLDYRILAPTEWNFHPAGVVAAGLLALAPDVPHRKALAQLHITAVDPCVDCVLAVT
ncbi:MAG: Ni,Fe-hydrogenase I large subunit [Chromatiaceae bacterium]|nr:MAG: Ni,Fe-hydrogenase I large subunit [Chromatiaceae bacterium]